jgi:PelA/Pel-15E family pectate lyase
MASKAGKTGAKKNTTAGIRPRLHPARTIYTAAICLMLSGVPAASFAGVIGQMKPAEELTQARISTLAKARQAAWLTYFAHSRALMETERAALAAERAAGATADDPVEAHGGAHSMPLDRATAWYATPEARHVADNIVSFQTPAGGWGKNVDRTGPVRQRGQSYVILPRQGFAGTIDNDATTTELRFLARVQAQAPGAAGQAYRDAFLKGVRYLLDSQYPNGGFPQVYPLQGGYHDAITFNDDALISVAKLLDTVAARHGDYSFVPASIASAARDATDKALEVILATQVVAGGVPTGWCQQHDMLTLAPVGARNFEPASLASGESASLLMYLMRVPNPSPQVVVAVHGGADWLRRVAVHDLEWTGADPGTGRRAVPKPGAGPLWSRFYDIGSMQPVFGDRDRSIHDDVNEISLERRNGYGWYGTWPAKALEAYASWASAHPLPNRSSR